MKSIAAVLACLTVHSLALSASAQQRPITKLEMTAVYGRNVRLEMTGNTLGPLTGELLAVTSDSLWVQSRKGVVTSVPVGSVGGGWVQRHNYTAAKGLRLGLLAGVASGVAMQLACNSVDEGNCTGVAPAIIALSAVITGLSSISLNSSSRTLIKPPSIGALAPYARFPQGPPPGVNLRELPRR